MAIKQLKNLSLILFSSVAIFGCEIQNNNQGVKENINNAPQNIADVDKVSAERDKSRPYLTYDGKLWTKIGDGHFVYDHNNKPKMIIGPYVHGFDGKIEPLPEFNFYKNNK